MRTLTISAVLSLVPTFVTLVASFAPRKFTSNQRPLYYATSPNKDNVDVDVIDIQRAKYCADHFGECSLDEIENLRNALHEERITHLFTDTDGIRNPHGLPEDVEHKLLETDLSLQMGLLKDKLATEHMQEESLAYYGSNPYTSTMNLPVLDGTLDEESSEAVMICLAIAALAVLPQFF
mmetsp:Transcript_7841/g.16063  ORF Transcript_7841/g.16063 Transcript_7841/m.16063 type:complete len:179 (+) Transcript_7841:149-685(+)